MIPFFTSTISVPQRSRQPMRDHAGWLRKLLLLLLVSGSLLSNIIAQENASPPPVDQKNNGGMLEPLKIAYITQRLNLTTEEAQRFWPIYNQYAHEMREARLEGRDRPDIEMDEILLNIRKKYNGQFANVLPSDKVNLFFRSEKEFNGIVRRELQHRAQIRNQQQRHPFRP